MADAGLLTSTGGRKMREVQQLVVSALLATLAAGLVSILILTRYLGERSPALLRTLAANLVLFNLLVAVGLAYRLAIVGPASTDVSGTAVHLLAALLLALSVLKVAWARALAAVALALRHRRLEPWMNRAAGAMAAAFGVAALAGWIQAARSGRFSVLLVGMVASDVVVLLTIVSLSLWLWRESGRAAGVAAGRAMRWFSFGNLAIVASIGMSFAASAVWSEWGGPVQALAHSIALLVYEVLLVAWAVRWASVWTEEARSGPGDGPVFALAADRLGLSKREREVAALLCHGRTNREIADELFIALQTVKDHNYRIFQKAGVRNRTELVRLLMRPDAAR